MERFDVIVIGAGVAGSAAAWRLAGQGRILLLEQFDLLHRHGSSHGESRIFRHAYEDRRYVDLALEADEGWQELERDAGEHLLYRTGGVDFGQRENPDLNAIEAALLAAGRPFEQLAGPDLTRRFPALQLTADQRGLFQPDAGILAASRCIAAMLRQAAARGVEIRPKEPVEGIDAGRQGVEIRTPRGHYRADRLIVAAGAWLSRLLADLALPLQVVQQQVVYLTVPAGSPFGSDRLPVFIDRDGRLYGFPRFERPDSIKLADHKGGTPISLAERWDEPDPSWAAATVARARGFLPQAGTEISHMETCLYTQTPDEHFILDLHPTYPNIVLAGGFSGHGFKFGPALGTVLAELAGGERRPDLDLFRCTRFRDSSA